MNKRKLFQKFNKSQISKDFQIKEVNIQMQIRKEKDLNLENSKGITLIALVISIIVMLILAGISLNAVIGDNGIITQAQNATYMQGIAALEEYLQMEYVKYYDEAENYTSKIELLASKMNNLCLKEGTRNYIMYNGKMYYLLNKASLPSDLKNQLKGGDTTEREKYIRLIDVYGITSDLKVYYCSNGTDTVLGTIEEKNVDPNIPVQKLNNDAEMKKAITEALAEQGIIVGENGITTGNVATIKELELDGSKYNIKSLSALSELNALQKLELKDINVSNLEGIDGCSMLQYIFFENCKIENYEHITKVLGLKYLYEYLPPDRSEEECNREIENLSIAMEKADDLNKLEYVGMFGYDFIRDGYGIGVGGKDIMSENSIVASKNKLSDIASLSRWSDTVKSSIRYMYLNNNSISNIESLEGYKNIYELWILNNSNLVSLNGLENHTNLRYIVGQRCNLSNISGLSGCSNLYYVTLLTNSRLTSLAGIENSNMYKLIAYNCNLTDISALETIKNTLEYLDIKNNSNLQNVEVISKCNKLNNLYLANNNNMLDADVIKLEGIIANCGTNYSLPTKYNMLFSNLTSYDYTSFGLTDTSREITSLKNKTNVEWLRLYGNTDLGKSRLAKLIKDGYLEIEELDKIKENLDLTEEQRSYIDSLKNKGKASIENMTDSEIESTENSSDIYIRYVLSTLTGLKKLSIGNIANITAIDFLNKVTNLSELDLRGTNITDLSKLETQALRLGTLAVDNTGIDFSKIQNTLNRIYDNYRNDNDTKSVWYNNSYNDINTAGLKLFNNNFENAFENCTNITKLNVNNESGGRIDLSKCVNLNYLDIKYGLIVTPNKNMNYVRCYYGVLDCRVTPYVKTVDFGENRDAQNSFQYMVNTQIETLDLGGYSIPNLEVLDNLEGCKSTLKNIRARSNFGSYYYKPQIGGLGKLEDFTKLETIILAGTRNSGILEGASKLKAVKELNVRSNDIPDISELSGLTTLRSLYLEDNKISNVTPLSNLTNLQILELSNNSINDIYPLRNLVQNGRTSITSLDLRNNLLENNNSSGQDNIGVLKLFKDTGTQIEYSGNNFSDTSILN